MDTAIASAALLSSPFIGPGAFRIAATTIKVIELSRMHSFHYPFHCLLGISLNVNDSP